MEINGKALADVLDPKDPTKVLVKAGEQLPSFAMLRDDGSHHLRQLDLLRLLVAGRQPHRHGATTPIRPASARP